jgi:transposase-like protein
MDFASWKDRKPIAAELKAIYRAMDADVARGRWAGVRGRNIRRSRPPWGMSVYPCRSQSGGLPF